MNPLFLQYFLPLQWFHVSNSIVCDFIMKASNSCQYRFSFYIDSLLNKGRTFTLYYLPILEVFFTILLAFVTFNILSPCT